MTMLHLIVVGEHHPADPVNDAIARAIEQRPRSGVVLRRCGSPSDLVAVVRGVRHTNGDRPIDLLDIVDHGGPGAQHLGSGEAPLFAARVDPQLPLEGAHTAVELGEHLAVNAHVRLLGCSTAGVLGTARDDAGRNLVFKLMDALNGNSTADDPLRRAAFGTLRPIGPADFATGRLLPRLESEILFSSYTALDLADAPDPATRLSALGTLRGQ